MQPHMHSAKPSADRSNVSFSNFELPFCLHRPSPLVTEHSSVPSCPFRDRKHFRCLSPKVKEFLTLWLSSININLGVSLFPSPQVVMMKDATLEGCGAHCQDKVTQDKCSLADKKHSIIWLKLKAIRLTLITFKNLVHNKFILVRTDNIIAKAHIN